MPVPAVTVMLAVFTGVKKPVKVGGDDQEEPGDVLHECREEEAG